ncbi:hypothetical protein KKG45_05490 [bacterium]|nr:hypothetical protein [bacterium]MBU1072683.1 hypothetical protein [bacterium]
MLSRRRIASWLIVIAVLATVALFGCRAFQPETVIVNHPPETYIIGAPQEGQGGQFHYHMFWTGTDRDGHVERYVWAVTAGSIQDPTTDEDEEDTRFNPAEFRETLNIGHWTTRTDSIFDFQIQQGSITTADKTFHIVAVDDRGDFDRSPARLYFLSNALGTPNIAFYSSFEQTDQTRFADFDTIGYGHPFEFSWSGGTPNDNYFTEAMLANTDTVGAIDGLYGFKYRLPLDVDCDAVSRDCWKPSRLDETTNRQVSYFSDVNFLEFASDNSGNDVFHKRMTQGVHILLVNTIDVAGVEIPSDLQPLNFVINYDPQTQILRDQADQFYDEDDVFNPGSPRVYPYYILHAPTGEISTTVFHEDERLPQRSIAVFKAIGWDDHRDIKKVDLPGEEAADFGVMFQGKFNAEGKYRGGENTILRFATQYTEAVESVWDDYTNLAIGSSDTVSFIVGPFDYVVSMRTVDEHGRRDGTPDTFGFFANHAPTVNCVDVVTDGETSGYYTEPCDAEIDTFYCSLSGAAVPGHPDWTNLRQVNFTARKIWYSPFSTGIWHERPINTTDLDSIEGFFFEYDLLLYAEDVEEERLFLPRTAPLEPTYGNPADRAFSWRYEIVSARDSLSNALREGGGFDDLTQITYTFNDTYSSNYDGNGVWRLRIEVFVPAWGLQFGTGVYKSYLRSLHPQWDEATIQDAFDLTTLQLGPNRATIYNRDGTDGDYRPDRCAYVYYTLLRVPVIHGESCTISYEGVAGRPKFDNYCTQSEPFVKRYVIVMVASSGEVFPALE